MCDAYSGPPLVCHEQHLVNSNRSTFRLLLCALDYQEAWQSS